MAYKIQKIENNGVTYANPADPDSTFRVKHSQTKKSLGKNSVQNSVTEIILNDQVAVAFGTTSENDAVSVRVRISGSQNPESIARKRTMMKTLAKNLTTWADSDVVKGFNPDTVPVE